MERIWDTDMEMHTVNLGNEFDVQLWKTLKSVIHDLGGQVAHNSWGVAGSQEIDRFEVKLMGTLIVVESETYIGITLTGSPSVVAKIQQLVASRMKTPQ